MLSRLSGHLRSVLAAGAVRVLPKGHIELRLDEDEAVTGGIAINVFRDRRHLSALRQHGRALPGVEGRW
jgi:hypothetical protein